MKTFLSLAVAASFLTACGPATTQPPQGVCKSAGGGCATNADCCAGFFCENSACAFVGGVGGNPTGGGPGSSSGSSSSSSSSGSTGAIGGFIGGGSTGGHPGGSTGTGTNGGHGTTGGSPGSSTGSSESSTGGVFTSASSSSSSSSSGSTGGALGTSTTGGLASNSSGGTSGGSTTGGTAACDTLSANYPSTCTGDGGVCASPLECVYDPSQESYQCVYPCTRSSDCPDIATVCDHGACLWNPCGETSEADGGTLNGTLYGACNAQGVNDGTCLPASLVGAIYVLGLCLQTGGTSTNVCNYFTRCSDRADLCETDWICPNPGTGSATGTCEEICNPSGPNTCPAGESCGQSLDGNPTCQPDAGTTPPTDGGVGDAGLISCTTTPTCGTCPSGLQCYCIDGTVCSAGSEFCVLGQGLCE